jgi:hypothetical protein
MEYKTITFIPALFMAVALTGCQGIKASTDNAEVQSGTYFDNNGKFTDSPAVSVPIYDSKGLNSKPQDVTPTQSRTG